MSKSSELETTEQMLDLESGTIHKMNKPALGPGRWRFPTNPDLCCIYRVPNCLREVNPKAYTPQLVLIGPLHYSSKSEALKCHGDITNANLMGYLNTEEHKKIYLAEFTKRVEGKKVIDGFRRIIEEEEEMIRASYSESTVWIKSPEFVEMILHDSVFIVELMLRFLGSQSGKIGDPLIDEPCLENTIKRDLILLENQLPYFILEKLFDPLVKRLDPNKTLRQLVIEYFELEKRKGKNISNNLKFRHFTDLFRCFSAETLLKDQVPRMEFDPIENLYSADKLESRGMTFNVVDEELSVEVKFNKKTGVLEIPCFWADVDLEIELRNMMAFEQSHCPFNAYVCDYIAFLDYLIDTEKDVDLLVDKGIIKNYLGDHVSVAKMVNKLCLGVMGDGSYYSKTASDVMNHYKNRCVKSRSILRRVYFSNIWRGTATVTAACILLLTLIQTVNSIIDLTKKK